MTQEQFKVMGPDGFVDQARKTGKGEEKKEKIQTTFIVAETHFERVLRGASSILLHCEYKSL